MPEFQLAQVNIARMRGRPGDAVMVGMMARIGEMNRLAEQSPGFVWRLPGSEATPQALQVFKSCFEPFEPERLFYNLSVWEDVEHLRQYAYRSVHAEMLRDKAQWMADLDQVSLALWWVAAGQKPTVAESAERLLSIQKNGPTSYAFTFRNIFPVPVSRPDGSPC